MFKMRREDIRQAIAELERQRPRNLEEFEFREGEIRRLLDMIVSGGARARIGG